MKCKSIILAATMALGLSGLAGLGRPLPTAAQTAAAQAAATERTDTFTIANMTCALCPVTVKTAIEHVDGVKSVSVNFDTKTATVVYDPSVATARAIAKASTNAGYPAAPVAEGG